MIGFQEISQRMALLRACRLGFVLAVVHLFPRRYSIDLQCFDIRHEDSSPQEPRPQAARPIPNPSHPDFVREGNIPEEMPVPVQSLNDQFYYTVLSLLTTAILLNLLGQSLGDLFRNERRKPASEDRKANCKHYNYSPDWCGKRRG